MLGRIGLASLFVLLVAPLSCGEADTDTAAENGAAGAAGSGGSAGASDAGCPALGCDPACGDAGVKVDENGCATCACNPMPDAGGADGEDCSCPEFPASVPSSPLRTGPCGCAPLGDCSHLYCAASDGVRVTLLCDHGTWRMDVESDVSCTPMDAGAE